MDKNTNSEKYILVLYDSRHGSVQKMAEVIARGIGSVSGMQAKIRTVPPISATCEAIAPSVPNTGAAYVELAELAECAGLALGSPAYFGNMTAALKYFWDQTTPQWLNNALANKPASVFTSSSSLHGGQESVLLTMMLPLLHHGMLIVGLPYSEAALNTTTSGGTPYGASHHALESENYQLSADEYKLCYAQGQRLALVANKLI